MYRRSQSARLAAAFFALLVLCIIFALFLNSCSICTCRGVSEAQAQCQEDLVEAKAKCEALNAETDPKHDPKERSGG